MTYSIKNPDPHPLGPKIIFSYGMTKCGSTLAFELARTGLELAGYPQPHLNIDGLKGDAKINFAAHLSPNQTRGLWNAVKSIGHPILIKTHTRPDPCVIELFSNGNAMAHATYRDPRDMALSMIDHGARNRELGKTTFTEITGLKSARTNINSQIDSLTQWLIRTNCLPLFFDDLAFDMEQTTRQIMAHLHLEIGPARVAAFVQNRRFTQRNKGVRRRFREEMTLLERQKFRHYYAPLFKHLIKPRKSIPITGEPIFQMGRILSKLMPDKAFKSIYDVTNTSKGNCDERVIIKKGLFEKQRL